MMRYRGLSKDLVWQTVFILLVGVSVLFAMAPEGVQAQPRRVQKMVEFPGGIHVGGHVNSIASYLDQDFQNQPGADTSAIDVNSLEVALTASPLRYVDASIVMLLEEGLDSGSPDDSFAVDQAFVTLAGNSRVLLSRQGRENLNVSPFYAQVGKFYVPFATSMAYHTFDVISEPQTLGMGETLETAFMGGYYPSEGVHLYAGAFSGDGADGTSSGGEDLDDIFAGVNLSHPLGVFHLQWMSNLNNSITLIDELDGGESANDGVNVFGSLEAGPVQFQANYTRVLDEYEQTANFQGREPEALSTELTYHGLARLYERNLDGTAVFEYTDEWFDHPETVWGVVFDYPLFQGVTGSLEYLQREFDPSLATRLDSEQLVSFQLSVEFVELLGQTSP